MPNTTLFVGSSAAAKSQARAFIAKLTSANLQFIPWWEAFVAGRTLFENLETIRCRVDGAILLFSPDGGATVRGTEVQAPNLNVLFEFGYFSGHFGRRRTAMLKYGEFHLPSDFGGYIHIHGSKFFNRGAVAGIAKRTELEFARWLSAF